MAWKSTTRRLRVGGSTTILSLGIGWVPRWNFKRESLLVIVTLLNEKENGRVSREIMRIRLAGGV